MSSNSIRPLRRRWVAPADWRVGVVLSACVWEIFAIVTGKVPTLTAISHRLRSHKIGRVALWGAFGWLIEHIFGENR